MTDSLRATASIPALFDQMAESVTAHDRSGRLLYVNAAGERLFARSAGEMLGRNLWEVFPQAAGNPFHQAFLRVAESGLAERFEHCFAPLQRRFSSSIYRAADVVWVIAHDTTERQIADEQAEKARKTSARAPSGAIQVQSGS